MSPKIVDDAAIREYKKKGALSNAEARALLKDNKKDNSAQKALFALLMISNELRSIGQGIKPTEVTSVEKAIDRLASGIDAIVEAMNKPEPAGKWSFTIQRDKEGFIKSVDATKR